MPSLTIVIACWHAYHSNAGTPITFQRREKGNADIDTVRALKGHYVDFVAEAFYPILGMEAQHLPDCMFPNTCIELRTVDRINNSQALAVTALDEFADTNDFSMACPSWPTSLVSRVYWPSSMDKKKIQRRQFDYRSSDPSTWTVWAFPVSQCTTYSWSAASRNMKSPPPDNCCLETS
ncbi:hypothetical protein PC9H_005906 [Pleurotus ostreatus]|uniref:Uncharacterized protein n=1 Tax=Pleurotus ostreatus TaxID=5322 RepID=A0A8H7DTL7_PLEOS|nr:uncharacterized protein PC9H_005906 [Pleurotus ostreatus]KAF7430204.1 hypothetical protein PC9H_005906 [Pleurotus ostreatus]